MTTKKQVERQLNTKRVRASSRDLRVHWERMMHRIERFTGPEEQKKLFFNQLNEAIRNQVMLTAEVEQKMLAWEQEILRARRENERFERDQMFIKAARSTLDRLKTSISQSPLGEPRSEMVRLRSKLEDLIQTGPYGHKGIQKLDAMRKRIRELKSEQAQIEQALARPTL